jgi:hypothetical protein
MLLAVNFTIQSFMFKVGVVGHRYFEKPAAREFAYEGCLRILSETKEKHKKVVALSALAEGADTLFAEAALSLDIILEIVIPFQDYISVFMDPVAKENYLRLRNSASRQFELPFITRSEAAYVMAMQWVASNSNLLVGVWNGKSSELRGGTADTIGKAACLGVNCIHLDVENLSVSCILPNK